MDWLSVILGAFIGVAGVFGLTSLALYPLMRRSFLLWNFARTMCFGGIAAVTLPVALATRLPFGFTPSHLGDLAIALSTSCSGPFLASYLEPGLSLGRLRRAMRWAALPGLLAAGTTLAAPAWRGADAAHDVLLLLAIALVSTGLAIAIRRGSRAARYQAVAWAPLIMVGLAVLAYELVSGRAFALWPLAVLLAVVFDFVITSLGLIDGFLIIKRERDEARADVREAQRHSMLDPLTGIANRRGLAQRFANPRRGRPRGIAVIDCDHFKRINDNFGHDVGDEVLIAVAEALKGEHLFVGRLGGEEFVALVYREDWVALAEAARLRIGMGVCQRTPQIAFPVTASAGLARVLPDDTLETAIKRADRALYAAKDAGRDRSLLLPEPGPKEAWLAHVR